MSDEMASELKLRLFMPVKFINVGIILLFFTGLGFIFGGLIFLILSYKRTVIIFTFDSLHSLTLLFTHFRFFLKY